MSIMENVKMALQSIRAHKLRSLLTMLGVIIGVAAVIIVVAIGQGGEAMIKSQIAGADNTLEIYYYPSDEEIRSNPNIGFDTAFSLDDIRSLESIPEVKRVVASSSEYSSIRHQSETVDAAVFGINDAYLQVHTLNVAEGISFSQGDFIGGKRTALISATLQEELFEDQSALGEIIRIGNQPVEIIGVLETPTGFFAFGSMDVYLPWQTWRSIYMKTSFSQVTLQANSLEELQVAGEKAVTMLNQANNTEDSYEVLNMEEIADAIGQITRVMTMIIGGIAGISLLVGGIGVMNIMLVSVTERTREIGIRKALGATRRQILFQFIIESIILTLIGGIIGILLGAGIATIISLIAGWPSLVSWPVILGGVLFSMLIGVLFGMLPANKASKLNPIDSLRYE
ncbi:ABC transporter permease [Alkalihalobacterium sp. APHAB7]|uniref:ABC transporter permease n=1 Tax=Alkalihalobacterium sp. APHAB7 TaxID=3402081 RepID=UPI003AADA95F